MIEGVFNQSCLGTLVGRLKIDLCLPTRMRLGSATAMETPMACNVSSYPTVRAYRVPVRNI